ncbi:unnamed protein product [Polarella glacialis]|uniref:Uncharacterized protein n=1 Tax=Polarella glacialis TaxID=89957 RepID=A0A813DV08_POLGL|nr:unnamed protein product [Polarella glacialis]CAE8699076.1 unnamed protein product [Polarella glacialis]
MREAFRCGIPSAMLHNTGGVTQTFVTLYRECVTQKKIMKAYENPNMDDLAKLDIVSSELWTRHVGPSTVEMMRRLEERAPEKIRSAYAVVDVLQDNLESIVEKVTACFASGGVGFPELSLGTAEQDIVLLAWHACMVFDIAARQFRLIGDILYYLSLCLAVVSGLLSISAAAYKEELKATAFANVNMLLLLLPMTSAFLAAVMGKRRHVQKWAVLHSSSRQIVSHIYIFRTRVLEYDEQSSRSHPEEEGKETAGSGGSGGGVRVDKPSAREVFVERFREVYGFALSNVGEDCLKDDSLLDRPLLSDQEAMAEFKAKLKDFVEDQILQDERDEGKERRETWSLFSCRRCRRRLSMSRRSGG